MRLLVTGSHGQLGSELVPLATAAGHAVVGVDRADGDITSPEDVRGLFSEHRPEVVVNCAAWTGVDAAETRVDGAYRVNAIGPRILAAQCRASGARLLHLSTDYVFDGAADSPRDEWASAAPLSVYGASKLAGEEEVRRLCPDHLVVRTAWMYGQAGPNFVLTMLRMAREGGVLRVVADQRGSPTWTGHLAPALLRLLDRGAAGTFHLTGGGSTTWHGFARAILDASGLERAPVEAISTADFPTPARRPAYAVLDNRAWRLLGEEPLPEWRVGLASYLKTLAT